ncbi:DUF4957 domain-containing protein [Arcticibacter sp. MXS-1]|uniref:DUF4957 domain-containing protein n=1 Tax=Arcticibacter sp. MXS-1 TaxID=3341726 RepID=UPI0035A953AA
MNFKKINVVIALAGLIVIAAASCKKDDVKVDSLPRSFQPVGAISAEGDTFKVSLKWKTAIFKDSTNTSYTVEVAKDSSFSSIVYSKVVDTTFAEITENELAIRQNYVARIKTMGQKGEEDSKWMLTPSFYLIGKQLFLPLVESNVTTNSVKLQWTPKKFVLNKLVVTPKGGAAQEIALNGETERTVGSLQENTTYRAELFEGTKSRGVVVFRTKASAPTNITLNPTDNLAQAVAAATDNGVIKLNPGTYTVSDSIKIEGKSVTIQSVSGNPSDTKVKFKEFLLIGDFSGLNVTGIEFDGKDAKAAYFISLNGASVNGAGPAAFKAVNVENCIIHDTFGALVRGSKGSTNEQSIASIKVNNSVAYRNLGTYAEFALDKIKFGKLEVTNSTFYTMSRGFINCVSKVDVKPTVLVNQCTVNAFGGQGNDYPFFDGGTNPVDLTVQNSIVSNTPYVELESTGATFQRSVTSGATVTYTNNNFFKLVTGKGTSLTLPSVKNGKTVDLGWTSATTDFSIAADSPLRTAGKTGGAIGDPRWVK